MAEFYAAVTTNLGVSLSADLLTGEQLEFTKLVAGGGNYSEEDLARTELQKATALRDQKQEFGFSAKEKVTDSCVLLKTLLSNEQLETGYRMTEIGIYAKKAGEEGDGILYSIAVAKEADYFPPYNGLAAVEIVEDYYISVSDAENVTIQTGRDTPVLAEEFEKFKEDVEKKFETIPKVVIGPEETEVEEKDVLLVTKDGKIGEVKKDGVKYPLMVRGDNVLTDETHLLVSQDEKDKWNAKPDPTSPVNQNVVNFVMAAARSMILSGEDLETLFSKLARWLNDLKAVALSGSYNDLTNRPNLGNAASQGVANNDTTTQAGYVADARIVRQHGVEIDQINSDLSGRLPNNVKIISEGSGANVKYYAQLGADTASKKALGRPQKYTYSNCLQGFKLENPSDMADSPATSCMVVYITNVPNYHTLTLDNLIIVIDFVSHESEGGCTYGYVYNAAVGRITIYPTSSNRFKRGNSGAATVYIMP